MTKIKMVMSIEGLNGQTIIKETEPKEVEDILLENRGGSRTFMNLPDISIYNPQRVISIDLYRVEENHAE